LVVIAGPDLGRQVELTDRNVDIGRGEDVTLRIDSELVSRRHAAVRMVAGRFAIADLESTNGTFVNDARIKTHKLVEGDRIRIGKVVMKYTECEIEASYHQQIVQRANVDVLTSAYNKRYFEDTMKRLYGQPRALVSLILFDIDHFKKINDTFGHAAGDVALQQVSSAVRGQLRDGDTLCRVGGEEFAVILEETNLVVARRAAEMLRATVETTRIEAAARVIPVTVSLGVAEREPRDGGFDALYKRADERLYEAKRGGRNRVS
jgi:diguanylate cyclase (GGDEF)-like protein